jgi:hypothetical protein
VDIAVAQDVDDLVGFEQRIDRHEDATGRGGTKGADDRFEALLQIDSDAFAATDAQSHYGGRESIDACGQLRIAQARCAGLQGHMRGRACCRHIQQMRKQKGVFHDVKRDR